MKNKWLKGMIHVVAITILATLLTTFVIDFLSLSILASHEKHEDFEMGDVFISAVNNKATKELSRQIVIVSTDGLNRAEIMNVINKISEQNPCAIGLDLYFKDSQPDSECIVNTVKKTPNLVCASRFRPDHDSQSFHPIVFSFYDTISDIYTHRGYVNFPIKNKKDVVRQFYTYTLTNNQDTLCSFASELARLAKSSSLDYVVQKGSQTERLFFDDRNAASISFDEVTGVSIINGIVDIKDFKNKIVLLGDLHNIDDMFKTSLFEEIPGVKMHAYATHTILSGSFIFSSSPFYSWFWAIVLCLFLVTLNYLLQNPPECFSSRVKDFCRAASNLIIRLIQVAFVILFVYWGFTHYLNNHKILNFAPSLLMIGSATMAYDIYFGIIALYTLNKRRK